MTPLFIVHVGSNMSNITDLDYSGEEDGELYELSLGELIFWCIVYAVIALLAVIGNSLVIFITLIRLRTRAVTTYFIINLAFADLLTGIFAIPFKFQAALFQEWFLPSSLCQIVPYAETVSLSVSVFTLTASAVHEFRTTFFPKRGRLTNRSARSLVLLIWVIAALVSLPHGLFHRVYLIQDGNLIIAQCRPVYADDNWWKIYNVYLTIIHYFVPMIILDTAYTMIAIKNKYKREYRRVFNCLRCRADNATEGEPQKFDTEYPAGVLERKWPNPYACDGAPFYSETFQISLPPSTETTSANQEKHL
ncbi:7 transmembrane receptor [Teladorsagia circumcincta]|uniref:7 transmembrane receptor n=1 Tax=Teladorsagia circumcincta TaxID=45464 RepID=A0A2G9UFY9_TELCI|nr:7 transmembrane receptor [Teladorsagia circumcincta]